MPNAVIHTASDGADRSTDNESEHWLDNERIPLAIIVLCRHGDGERMCRGCEVDVARRARSADHCPEECAKEQAHGYTSTCM